jgi:pimeloyl-ACP methyl ester carboxylesterase
MDALDVERAALVGCSMGGSYAIEVALAAPDRVTGLAVSDLLSRETGCRANRPAACRASAVGDAPDRADRRACAVPERPVALGKQALSPRGRDGARGGHPTPVAGARVLTAEREIRWSTSA